MTAVSPTPEEAAASWHESHICGHFGASVRPGKCGACAVRVLLAALRDARRENGRLALEAATADADWKRAERERDQARDAIRQADIALACAQLPCRCDEGDDCYCLEYPTDEQIRKARAALGGAAEDGAA